MTESGPSIAPPPCVQIGDITCHVLSDGKHRLDGGGFFGLVPRVLWEKVIAPDASNTIPTAVRCLLIATQDQCILVDTGHGDKYSEKIRQRLGLPPTRDRLLVDLARAGFQPEDVTTVLLTHLHNDHAGGMTRWVNHEEGAPTEAVFPNATYIVQGKEYEATHNTNERTRGTYFQENWQCLVGTGQLQAVFGGHDFGHGVRSETAAGHTESLQVIWVESGSESLLFLGDAANWGVHLERLAWVPSFDILPMVSLESKRKLRFEIMERSPLLVFQHDAHYITAWLHGDTSRDEFRLEGDITEEATWDRITQSHV